MSLLPVNSLALWERVGVRKNNRTKRCFTPPHPNLLPQGEGTVYSLSATGSYLSFFSLNPFETSNRPTTRIKLTGQL